MATSPVTERFHISTTVMVTQVLTFVKFCENVHLNWLHFILCKVYLKELIFRKKQILLRAQYIFIT